MAQDQQHGAHEDHGHSVAAWTTVALMSIGTLVGAFAFPANSAPMFWVGVAIILAAAVIGYVWSRSTGGPAIAVPAQTKAEGPTRGAEGTNRA